MNDLKQSTVLATLIGDIVGSRVAADRSVLHERLVTTLAEANTRLRPVVPLRITVADEFQGCFPTVGEALHASLWLRLRLAPVQLRHGVGWGAVGVLAEEPRVEDGPGWWVARAAIEAVKADASRAGTRLMRTAYRLAEETDGPDPGAVNAALVCRDQMIGSMSERSLRLLRGVLDGDSQAELAAAEGISASAVSQRVRNDGLAMVALADELLEEVR
ncbi:SatD family protein [Marmoricola sp. URHB0036]|uniref:SatD family protein n=1 Tax=Marmoricola sp. URHB0036 TaxID=1298863 RepID=UPI0004004A6D|nr:SatD family protein [Marmoricola sp. URHB0036]